MEQNLNLKFKNLKIKKQSLNYEIGIFDTKSELKLIKWFLVKNWRIRTRSTQV